MRTLVVEMDPNGHRFQWAGTLASSLSEIGAEVIVATTAEAIESEDYKVHLFPHEHKFQLHIGKGPPAQAGTWTASTQRLQELAKLVKEVRPDRVYLPTADGLAQQLGIARFRGRYPLDRSVALEGLIMNGAVAHPPQSRVARLRQRLSYELAKAPHWDRFYHLNPFVAEMEEARSVKRRIEVGRMPEPVEAIPEQSKEAARSSLGLPTTGVLFGMVGGINRRKGADIAIEGFAQANLPADSRLVLFGPFDKEMKRKTPALMADPRLKNRLLLRDELLTDDDLATTLSALDLVLLPYLATALSSGIASRAAAANRPFLITAGGWGERMIELFDLGWCLKSPTPEGVRNGLEQNVETARNWSLSAAGRRFVAYNTIPNFAAHWTSGARAQLGQQPSEDLRSWRWATTGAQ